MVLFVRYSAVFVTQKKVFVSKKIVFVTKKKVFVTIFFFQIFVIIEQNQESTNSYSIEFGAQRRNPWANNKISRNFIFMSMKGG